MLGDPSLRLAGSTVTAPKSTRGKARSGADLRDRIVEAALDIAEDWGWYDIRLHHVAKSLGVPLAEVRAQFRDTDAIADAWLARADQAMLAKLKKEFAALPAQERLQVALEAWLDALAPRRKVTADIFRTKLWPVHVHHNLALIAWTSRTVQWWREAALLDAKGSQRSVEEIGMTLVFLATLRRWCRDGSEGQVGTKEFLGRRLEGADRLMARWFAPHRPAADTEPPDNSLGTNNC